MGLAGNFILFEAPEVRGFYWKLTEGRDTQKLADCFTISASNNPNVKAGRKFLKISSGKQETFE